MFLLAALLLLLSWYCWSIYAPYSKFRNILWVDWHMVYRAILGKGPGNIPLMSFLFQKLLFKCKRFEDEGMCVIWVNEPMLFIYGEEAVKFFSNETSLNNKAKIYKLLDFLGEHVELIRTGENWKKYRKMSSPSFGTNAVKSTVPVMNSHATALVQQLADLKGNVTNEMDEIISACILRLFLEAFLNIKGDTAEKETKIKRIAILVAELLDFVASRILRPWMHYNIVLNFSASGRKQKRLIEELHSIVGQVLEELIGRIHNRNQSVNSQETDTGNDVSHCKSHVEDTLEEYMKDPSVTMEVLTSHFSGIIFAGFHTVTLALTWCLWLLGLNQDIQEQAYEEIMSVTPEGDVQYDDVTKMTYLECIIKESMRLYPLVPLFARCSDEDLQFGKYTVPKDTTIVFFPYLLHRNQNIYPDPEAFNPDRFAETDSNIKPWTFIPFAEGVRSCLGKNFAMLEMKIILAHVIRNFKMISLDRREDVHPTYEIMLRSSIPLRMQFLPR